LSAPLSSFSNMPAPVKAGVTLAAGGGIVAALGAFMGPQGFLVILAGVAVVGLILVGYKLLLKKLEKRKANPFTKGLAQNSAAAPQSVSEPAKRARLDDLRKTFETGVEKFRAAGKNLYAVPWYMLVGEPGSGKTEAIRHCNVGFPPGLQDQLQGAGGTLNMNWWFTNHAVILDTAGRLMFEEAPPGQTSEWQEFLKLLRASRPNCPVNGMLLVIPADSLIRDTADAIERKAGKIAQQLDSIQRALGVRFPVFVVITKCDLINGFREFFGDLDDPQVQHQILGWSNHADLDEPFKPEAVEEHLTQVRSRMVRRRTLILQDPVNTENPSGRRIDQVDALYAFPESIAQIGPRLRRYLEMIFVAGEWSNRPLFLRGIYFTSSMREGSALDADLAEALGVSIESLPEGRVWERDRAYFLRDLFMNKVFKEKGLVTRAGNVRSVQRRRRAAILAAGFGTVAILAGLMAWSTVTFRKNVGSQVEFWEAAATQAKAAPSDLTMIRDQGQGSEFLFRGSSTLPDIKGTPTLVGLHTLVAKQLETPVRVPGIFAPVAGVLGDVERKQFESSRALYVGSVLRPAVDLARVKLARTSQPWSDRSTAALAQLVRLETLAAGRAAPAGASLVDIGALYRFVLTSPADFDDNGGSALQPALDKLFPPDQWESAAKSLGATEPAALNAAVGRFVEYWASPAGVGGADFAAALELRSALSEFRDIEQRLLAIDDASGDTLPATLGLHEPVVASWKAEYEKLAAAYTRVNLAVQKAGPDIDRPADLARKALDSRLKEAQAAYDSLRAQTGPAATAAAPASSAGSPVSARLDEGWTQFKAAAEADAKRIEVDLTEMKAPFLAVSLDPKSRLYEVRYRMYEAADGPYQTPPAGDSSLGTIAAGIAAYADRCTKAQEAIANQLKLAAQSPLCVEASKTAGFAVNLARRGAVYAALLGLADSSPANPADFAAKVQALGASRTDFDPLPKIMLPLTAMERDTFSFDPRYLPGAAGLAMGDWAMAVAAIDPSRPSPALEAEALRTRMAQGQRAAEAYGRDYVSYWSGTVPGVNGVPQVGTWAAFHKALLTLDPYRVNRDIGKLLETCDKALKAAPESLAPDAAAGARRIKDELDELQDRRFDADCEAAKSRWAGLGPDETAARASILAMSPEAFRSELLTRAYSEKNKGVRYWNGLILAAISSLAKSAQDQGVAAISSLAKGYAAYPLIRSADRAAGLSKEQVAAARALADKIGAPSPDARARMMGPGGDVNFPLVSKQVGLLVGEGVLTSEQEISWLKKLQGVLAFLDDQKGPQDCEILILDPTTSPPPLGGGATKSAMDDFAWIEIGVGQGASFSRFTTRNAGTDSVRVRMPGPPVTVRFLKTTAPSEVPAGPVVFQSDWNVTALAQATGVLAEPPGPGGKQMVQAPVIFSDADGKQYCFWIGVRFDRPVPDLAQWPTKGEWPVR